MSIKLTARLTVPKFPMVKSSVRRFLWLLLAIPFVGCSGPKIIPVSGKVTYQGKPLEFGSVMFQPPGNAAPARGQIDSDGSFQLTTESEGDGCNLGMCRVRVTSFEGQRRNDGGSSQESLGALLIPKKYTRFGTSGISIEVAEGMHQPVLIELE